MSGQNRWTEDHREVAIVHQHKRGFEPPRLQGKEGTTLYLIRVYPRGLDPTSTRFADLKRARPMRPVERK